MTGSQRAKNSLVERRGSEQGGTNFSRLVLLFGERFFLCLLYACLFKFFPIFTRQCGSFRIASKYNPCPESISSHLIRSFSFPSSLSLNTDKTVILLPKLSSSIIREDTFSTYAEKHQKRWRQVIKGEYAR